MYWYSNSDGRTFIVVIIYHCGMVKYYNFHRLSQNVGVAILYIYNAFLLGSYPRRVKFSIHGNTLKATSIL